MQPTLDGRRGWTTVTLLALVLLLLVAGQIYAQDASASGPIPRAATSSMSTSSAATPSTARTSAAASGPGRELHDLRDRPVARPRPAVGAPAVEAALAATPAALPAGDIVPAAPAAPAVPAVPASPAAPAVAVPAPPAPAAPVPAAADPCSGSGWEQRRGAAALASLRVGAERTGFRVEFAAARTGYLGLTHLQERRIEMFVRGCSSQTDELLRHVMAHELGHAYDTTHGNAAVRAAYQAARGIPASTPWYGCSGCTDFATPAGDFAEVYAQWARGASTNRSELAGDVGPAELDQLAATFFGA